MTIISARSRALIDWGKIVYRRTHNTVMKGARSLCFLAISFLVSTALFTGGLYGMFKSLEPRYPFDFLFLTGLLGLSLDAVLVSFLCFQLCKTGSIERSAEELDSCYV